MIMICLHSESDHNSDFMHKFKSVDLCKLKLCVTGKPDDCYGVYYYIGVYNLVCVLDTSDTATIIIIGIVISPSHSGSLPFASSILMTLLDCM